MSEQENKELNLESDERQDEKNDVESKTLREALAKFHIELPEETIQTLDDYCDLLWIWNERLNLTRHETYDKFVARDLVDSMRIAARLQSGERVLDVGSGGGAPGLIIAILRPDVEIELCEATGKKAKALGDMVEKLDLDVPVWCAKAQELVEQRRYHTLTVRAVGKMKYLLELFAKTWNNFTRLVMVKGPKWPDERGEARHYNLFNKLALRKIDEYEIPDDGHTSVLLQVCKKTDFALVERHAKDLAAGKPYGEPIEDEIAPEDVQTYGVGSPTPKRRARGYERDVRRRAPRRGYAKIRDRREESGDADGESRGGEERVATRRSGKPPKGWTGKKREFKVEDFPEGVRPGRSGGGRRRGQAGGRNSAGSGAYSKRNGKTGGSKRRPDSK